MDDNLKQARIMGEMRDDLLEVIGKYAENHRGVIDDATYMGAVNWLLADLMIATNTPPDDAFLSRLSRTIELVRMKNALESQESIH
jgi:hypothetical protein